MVQFKTILTVTFFGESTRESCTNRCWTEGKMQMKTFAGRKFFQRTEDLLRSMKIEDPEVVLLADDTTQHH